MCFSATASFLAGSTLLTLGAITVHKTTDRRTLALAAVPLLFGVQQMIEGGLWLAALHHDEQLKSIMAHLFTMFSHVLWPVYIPFAIGMLEIIAWRKRTLWLLQLIGLSVGIHLLIQITTQPLTAEAEAHVVYVSGHSYAWPMMILYMAATCLAPLLSSQPLIRLFGAMALLLFAIAYLFYTAAYISVWCFFAAILSTIIYLHIVRRTPGT
ncbi:hypothetical protein FEF65_03980 [Mariprofundus erugo]|uniref:Uncharacterized protein n=1 Tax=Mariprofundus erugo TaxID=2528639 RepID=A0A5R9GV46_9PROT|nr:DUF6629 family protein [Mariprofundus erugo]TLS68163.1 hypothetical protein FEF65_03980 [Mariprofundus erugo]